MEHFLYSLYKPNLIDDISSSMVYITRSCTATSTCDLSNLDFAIPESELSIFVVFQWTNFSLENIEISPVSIGEQFWWLGCLWTRFYVETISDIDLVFVLYNALIEHMANRLINQRCIRIAGKPNRHSIDLRAQDHNYHKQTIVWYTNQSNPKCLLILFYCLPHAWFRLWEYFFFRKCSFI